MKRMNLPGPKAQALIERDRAVISPRIRALIHLLWIMDVESKCGMSTEIVF